MVSEHNSRIKILRRLLGYNLSEFAARLGLSVSYLSEIESGKKNISELVLYKLSRSGINPDWVLKKSPLIFLSYQQGVEFLSSLIKKKSDLFYKPEILYFLFHSARAGYRKAQDLTDHYTSMNFPVADEIMSLYITVLRVLGVPLRDYSHPEHHFESNAVFADKILTVILRHLEENPEDTEKIENLENRDFLIRVLYHAARYAAVNSHYPVSSSWLNLSEIFRSDSSDSTASGKLTFKSSNFSVFLNFDFGYAVAKLDGKFSLEIPLEKVYPFCLAFLHVREDVPLRVVDFEVLKTSEGKWFFRQCDLGIILSPEEAASIERTCKDIVSSRLLLSLQKMTVEKFGFV